jgi:signal transduction histidine kinase
MSSPKLRITNGDALREARKTLFLTIIGALAGYLIVHPYAMFAYYLTEPGQGDMQWKVIFLMTLRHMKLPMAVEFIFFGSLIGCLLARVLNKQEKLHAMELANEKHRAALETLQRLMITLSHYLLNSNAVIGGMAGRCKKHCSERSVEEHLSIIEDEARKIDAVIKVLRTITEIKTSDYTSGGRDLMIDISQEIEKALGKTEKK